MEPQSQTGVIVPQSKPHALAGPDKTADTRVIFLEREALIQNKDFQKAVLLQMKKDNSDYTTAAEKILAQKGTQSKWENILGQADKKTLAELPKEAKHQGESISDPRWSSEAAVLKTHIKAAKHNDGSLLSGVLDTIKSFPGIFNMDMKDATSTPERPVGIAVGQANSSQPSTAPEDAIHSESNTVVLVGHIHDNHSIAHQAVLAGYNPKTDWIGLEIAHNSIEEEEFNKASEGDPVAQHYIDSGYGKGAWELYTQAVKNITERLAWIWRSVLPPPVLTARFRIFLSQPSVSVASFAISLAI